MKHQPTYLFAGGGSGGHLFPGLAVAAELQARDEGARVVFAGSQRGIERDIVRDHQYRHARLPVEPSSLLRSRPLRFAWRNWLARARASALIRELSPTAVIGLGGFASVPVVLAARARRVPVLLLEQNIVPGRATRWLSGWASLVCLSFDELHGRLSPRAPLCVTGNPVAREIVRLHGQPSAAGRPQSPALLILGGSQGAAAVNDMALAALEQLRGRVSLEKGDDFGLRISDFGFAANAKFRKSAIRNPKSAILPARFAAGDIAAEGKWSIMHQTGAARHAEVAARYAAMGIRAETAPFFGDMAARYARASLAITRGGATSLAELAVAGVPAIVVPYPNSIGDHQRQNARYYESHQAARVVEQQAGDAQAMSRILSELISDPERCRTMSRSMHALAKPEAAGAVADRLLELTGVPLKTRRAA